MHISKPLSREFRNMVLSSSNRYISQDYLYHILFYAALPFELDKSACVLRVGTRLMYVNQINNIQYLCIYIQLKVGLTKIQHS